MRRCVTALLITAVSVSACTSVQLARPQLPAELHSQAEEIPLRGIGISQRGDFTAGVYKGSYRRSLRSTAREQGFLLAKGTKVQRGRTEFTLQRADTDDVLSGDCSMHERDKHVEGFTLTTEPFALRCTLLEHSGATPFLLHIDGIEHPASLVRERSGTLDIQGHRLTVESVHRTATGARTQTVLGYGFAQNGESIAVAEIGASPRLVLAKDISPSTRAAVLLAGTALSLFWDSEE
jgi:hypothetical protein